MEKIPISQLDIETVKLIETAREAIKLSYSPYSNFRVGAAVILENGIVVKGANQENSSYPVGICAERAALATAQNLYPNIPVVAISLAAKDCNGQYTPEVVTPCGMCRQALAECEKRYGKVVKIIMSSEKEVVIADSLNDILPMAFS